MIIDTADHQLVAAALAAIRPDAQWSSSGDTLIWHDTVQAEPTAAEIDAAILSVAKSRRIAEAYAESQARFAASTVTVMVAGEARAYGCDPATRENITAINTAIGRAPELVPNPRPFTPRGAAPVMTTHAEFLAIYIAGLAQGDAFYGAYFAHKTAIGALTTVEAVAAYDITTGWPPS